MGFMGVLLFGHEAGGISASHQGWNPHPVDGKGEVLTIGPQGRPHHIFSGTVPIQQALEVTDLSPEQTPRGPRLRSDSATCRSSPLLATLSFHRQNRSQALTSLPRPLGPFLD